MDAETRRRLIALVEGLADQQAMPDDWWKPELAAVLDTLPAEPPDLVARHEALRVAVLNIVAGGPDQDAATMHAELAAAFNADRPAHAPK